MEKYANTYYERTDVTGVIIAIGERTLDDAAYIRLDSQPFRIDITIEQEKELCKLYKSSQINATIRTKNDLTTGKVLEATLIDFEVFGTGSAIEGLLEVVAKQIDLIKQQKVSR